MAENEFHDMNNSMLSVVHNPFFTVRTAVNQYKFSAPTVKKYLKKKTQISFPKLIFLEHKLFHNTFSIHKKWVCRQEFYVSIQFPLFININLTGQLYRIREVCEYLNEMYTGGWIGRREANKRPVRSPDLKLTDILL